MHRAGYVCGCVAIRGVVSHRGCGAGPGPVGGLVAFPPSAGHPGGRVLLRRRVRGRVNGLAAHAEEPPPFWWGAAPLRILDVRRVSYEGRPRGVCCRSMPGKE